MQTPIVSWTITSCLVAIFTNYNEPNLFNFFSKFLKEKKNKIVSSENIEAFRNVQWKYSKIGNVSLKSFTSEKYHLLPRNRSLNFTLLI